MRRIVALIFTATVCQAAVAEQPPVVGLWEQVIAGDKGDGSVADTQRIDVVFVDQKIDEDTKFSGFFDAYTKVEVLCCVNVDKGDLITLPELLKKYSWDPETADHLKKIRGWKYIYEAKVVDPGQRNARMRDLIKELTVPPTLSPYSAPVIAGKIDAPEINKKFKLGSANVSYSNRASKEKYTMSYTFLINGKLVTLSEEMFPAE